MKEHKETKSSSASADNTDQHPTKVLKSLLKKPGDKKSKSQKNRVVINEKMNEFFAADYIILIKEECCADYEEECDCCCQEHEMIRLGNCKECRAELNLRFNDEDVDSEDLDSDDIDEDEHDHTMCGRNAAAMVEVEKDKPLTAARRQQQRETLSPPEGYKDLCVAAQQQQELEDQEEVCAECDFYQRQAEAAAAAAAASASNNSNNDAASTNDENNKIQKHHENRNDDPQQKQQQQQQQLAVAANGAQPSNDHAQQTTPDVQQRYLVETITMTTVTERRIVREISEEETTRPTNANTDEPDHSAIESSETPKNGEVKSSIDSDKPAELTLAFKLQSNSLKPNSAVRQLFPDPRFISPPPAPVKSVSSDLEDSGMDDGEGPKLSSDGLRTLPDDSSIKRTIERNALRRSLCKYDTGSLKKKSLKSKDLSLEERIRQLTCVDDDEDAADTSVSENNNSGKVITNHHHHNNNNMNGLMSGRTIGEGEDHLLVPMHQLPARTSPSGEERPKGHVVQSHHHHHHNSAYKKITDLFGGPKKNNANAELNLPDIGLGAKQAMAMKTATQKLSSEARKQFLASLAPLSCVGSSGVDGRDDYYRMPAKPGDRNSVGYNSDSSYSLEDIEDALQEGIPAPPDVTRGTPTSAGPSLDSFGGQDAHSDELLAFVEQEKTRTERIKRRYDIVEEKRNDNDKNSVTAEEDDEDDELNDYGFNRRPSVRGIKAQFETTNEIVRQLRTRSAAATSLPEACRLNFPAAAAASIADDDSASSSSDMYHLPYGADPSTVSRINSMQKQINEIYQSITEGGVGNLLEPTSRPATSLSYLESTLPRTMMPSQDHRHNGTLRMLRMTGGDATGTTAPLGVYSTLPKPHRHPAGYSYAVPVANPAAVQAAAAAAGAKCYRTMYFVPYNGMSDPTYQNLQRILPPAHTASPTNYAEHLERYPYPRNGGGGQQQQQQQARYYVRPASIPNTQAAALHLHLHQAEEFRLQAQQQQQQQQSMSSQQVQQVPVVPPPPPPTSSSQQYSVQTLSGESYSICPPPPPSQTSATYTYQMQIQGRLSASDMPTPTSLPASSQLTSSLLSSASLLANSSLPGSISSGTSSLLSSPTKLPPSNMGSLQRNSSCSVAERGVPEGAASAPSHDYVSAANAGLLATTTQSAANIAASFVDNGTGNIVDAQNPVYYAMNV